MRVLFACSPGKKHLNLLRDCNVEHLLVSYSFIKDVDQLMKIMDGYKPKSFTLDSGAFSVWSKGKTMDWFSYSLFAKKLRERLPAEVELNVVNLDVLPGEWGRAPTNEEREESARLGWENMIKLENEGLKVIHVYHQHEKLEWLDKMTKHSDYIGISPANDLSQKQKNLFMDSVYLKIRNSVKTHGFAVTSYEQVYRYPLYSVDSSSWASAARFGSIALFYDDMSIHWLKYKDKKAVLKHWDYISHLGIKSLSTDDWLTRTALAIKSYQKLQDNATKIWAKRGITWTDTSKSV